MLSEQIIEFLREYIYNDYLLLFVVSAIPLKIAYMLGRFVGGVPAHNPYVSADSRQTEGNQGVFGACGAS